MKVAEYRTRAPVMRPDMLRYVTLAMHESDRCVGAMREGDICAGTEREREREEGRKRGKERERAVHFGIFLRVHYGGDGDAKV